MEIVLQIPWWNPKSQDGVYTRIKHRTIPIHVGQRFLSPSSQYPTVLLSTNQVKQIPGRPVDFDGRVGHNLGISEHCWENSTVA